MGREGVRSPEIWELALRQHGVISRGQLLALGLNDDAIHHRCETGRLYRVRRGVYLVGRPGLSRSSELMAAVLACGTGAVLSHRSAAELYSLIAGVADPIEITVPAERRTRQRGIRVHRRDLDESERAVHESLPLTAPACTLLDLATLLPERELEAAIAQADKLDLITPPALRLAMKTMPPRPGKSKLANLLDHHAFTLTDSELERRFLPIARAAGLSKPLTQQWLHGYRLDFYWPELGLVVETDGLRYHRTATAQARDRTRDQVMTAAGLTVLRFTHAQVHYERRRVVTTLASTARRLQADRKIA